MVGGVGVAINTALFLIAFNILKIHYLISFAFGYLMAFFFAFYFNMIFTFRIKNKKKFFSMMLKYFFVSVVTLVIGGLFLRFLVEFILINANIAFFINLGLTTILNFVGNKFYSFRMVGEPA